MSLLGHLWILLALIVLLDLELPKIINNILFELYRSICHRQSSFETEFDTYRNPRGPCLSSLSFNALLSLKKHFLQIKESHIKEGVNSD